MPQSVFTDAYASVVEYLIALRMRQNMHQAELARRLGKRQQFVSKVENRLRRLDVVEFYAYASALGADPAVAIAEIYANLPHDVRV